MPRRVANRIEQLDVFPSYKGGHTCLMGGYVFEFAPTHCLANGWGWVGQHRLVGEDIAGRPLRQSSDPDIAEHVHHRDEVKTNNAPSNLEVMTMREHRTHHARKRAAEQKAMLTEQMAREALEGRTIREAAAHLHVDHMTLRNRFPELLAPRKRQSPSRADDQATMERIMPYARSPDKGLKQAARELKIAGPTILKCCRHFGVAWVHKARPGRPKKANQQS